MNTASSHDIDLLNICRICLKKTNEPTGLFCDTEESNEIIRKLSTCFNIILNSEEYLPSSICNSCSSELDISYNFWIKCVTINERFKQYCESARSVETRTGEDFTEQSHHLLEGDTLNSCESPAIPTDPVKGYNKCEICDKVLKSVKSLEKHIISMHEKRKHIGKVTGCGSTRRYHCTTCSYETPHSQTLVNHMRRHTGDRPFNCECGKNFTQASSLAAHQKTHTDVINFICSKCGKQFKHTSSFKMHLQVHFEGRFQCTLCSKVLKTKGSLHDHMKRHNKVYDYNCEDCGRTFVTSVELYKHRQKHSVNKSVVCRICDFATKTRRSLLAHLKRHEGNKACKCNFCNKSFFTAGDLNRHMRSHVHTREKPYSCKICSHKYTYSSSLNRHMLSVHGVQYKWADAKWKDGRLKNMSMKSDQYLPILN